MNVPNEQENALRPVLDEAPNKSNEFYIKCPYEQKNALTVLHNTPTYPSNINSHRYSFLIS